MKYLDHYHLLEHYWASVGVVCQKGDFSGKLADTELAQLWSIVGMPKQDWWHFRFLSSEDVIGNDDEVIFGRVYEGWKLLYRIANNSCIFIDESGNKRFANTSFTAFARMLILFDEGYRRVNKECPGDSGEEWDQGDIIIQHMESAMRLIDPLAFERESSLWPYLLIDING